MWTLEVRGFPGFRPIMNRMCRFLRSEWKFVFRTLEKRVNRLPLLPLGATKLKFPVLPNYPMALALTTLPSDGKKRIVVGNILGCVND